MDLLVKVAFVIWLFMTIVFFLALIKKDNSIVDVFWGLGFIVVSVYSLISSGNFNLQTMILNFFVLLWGLRLSIHIFIRNKGKGEDFRYKAGRDTWKYFVVRSYFQVFILQGIFMMIVSSPVFFVNQYSDGSFHINDYVGIILFLVGFAFETLSDYQLLLFKKILITKERSSQPDYGASHVIQIISAKHLSGGESGALHFLIIRVG